jgi:uncharacterized membrane protein (UPF0127 family)
MRNLLALVGVVVIVSAALYTVFRSSTPSPIKEVSDSPVDFTFEIASTTDARTLGLSGRTHVPEDYGMLFVFPEPGRYGIWMKDMHVAIDIVWLSKDGTIRGIDANVSPDTYPKVFYPPAPISFVLETREGEVMRQGWEVGTRLSLP